MTAKQHRGLALMWAYLRYHAKKDARREYGCWLFLLMWAELGGKTSEVPKAFGGTAIQAKGGGAT